MIPSCLQSLIKQSDVFKSGFISSIPSDILEGNCLKIIFSSYKLSLLCLNCYYDFIISTDCEMSKTAFDTLIETATSNIESSYCKC